MNGQILTGGQEMLDWLPSLGCLLQLLQGISCKSVCTPPSCNDSSHLQPFMGVFHVLSLLFQETTASCQAGQTVLVLHDLQTGNAWGTELWLICSFKLPKNMPFTRQQTMVALYPA